MENNSADEIQLFMCPEKTYKLRSYKHYATLAELESAVPSMEHYFGKFWLSAVSDCDTFLDQILLLVLAQYFCQTNSTKLNPQDFCLYVWFTF